MTESELVDFILREQKEKVEIKYIKARALTLGFTAKQFDSAMEAAHIKKQQLADSDPVTRLLLGPTLLIIAGICFYTDWSGRSVGFASFLGLATLYPGLRLVISLIKQWTKR